MFLLSILLACAVPDTAPPAFLTHAMRAAPASFSGTITEVIQVRGYTYANVREASGVTRWIVTLEKPLQVSESVDVRPFGQVDDFESALSGRRFDTLIFASLTPRTL